MICVLDIIDGPARGKRIWVKENQCVEVGRISTADFSVPLDAHMSRRHLLFDSTQNSFRVRDVGSANGTYLNNAKVTVHELGDGDRIRAGMTIFLVSFREKDVNPHEQDGISFGQSLSRNDRVESDLAASDEDTLLSMATGLGQRSLDFSSLEESGPVSAPVLKAETVHSPNLLDAASIQIPLHESNWWRDYFIETQIPHLFDQTEACSQSYIQLLKKFAESTPLYFVVNQSQLSRTAHLLVSRYIELGKIDAISKTLYFSAQSDFEEFWDVVQASLGQDAIICFGTRNPLRIQELAPIVNSLSFPSMFKQHLMDTKSIFRKQMLLLMRFALYESGEDKLSLLMRY